jgi:hypothetical protein
MNRGYLALGAAVVLVAVIGLVLVLRSGDDGAAKPDPEGPKFSETKLGKPSAQVTHAPSVPESGASRPAELAGSGTAVSEYTVGGVRVRDHRSGNHAPLDVPPAIHPPEGRKISSQLTADLAQKLRVVTEACTSSLPPQARGAKPRLDGEILIAIKDQQATVTSATFQARDVAGASEGPIKQCMEQKTVGVATPSGDEPDLQGYAITLSLRIP